MNIIMKCDEKMNLISKREVTSEKTGKKYYYLGIASNEGMAELKASKLAYEDAEKVGKFGECKLTIEYNTNYEFLQVVGLHPIK